MNSAARSLRDLELERELLELERADGSPSLSSSSAAIQLRNEELERKLAKMEAKSGSNSMSSASIAVQLKNEELERKLAKMEAKAGSNSMSSASFAVQLKNQELEQKLAKMEAKSGSNSMSSASFAVQLKNQELERKLAKMEAKSGSNSMSSASFAVQLKNQELEQKLAKMEAKSGSNSMSSASVAVQLKNQELERKLAKMEAKSGSNSMSSASVAVQLKNQELERKIAELKKGKSRSMSSASVAVHEKNRKLEMIVEELEGNMTSSGQVMSSGSVAVMRKNEELERNFIRLSSMRKTDALSASRAAKVNERVIKLKKLITASQELDLAFLVDATLSMQPYIDSVKTKVRGIAAGVQKAWPQLKLRTAFAPYRDYEHGARDDAETCDFTDDFVTRNSVFVAALSKVQAVRNDDTAEDVFSGLERVATLSWKSRTRVLVHIGDSPCHGREFHDFTKSSLDRYPDGDLKGRDISTLLKTLRDGCQIICYLFCHVDDSTKKMLSVFKNKSEVGNWIHEEKLSNIDMLEDVVVNFASASISQSVQVGDSKTGILKFVNLSVRPEMPIWHQLPREPATQIRYKIPDSLEHLFHTLATNGKLELTDMPDSKVQIAHFPFSGDGSLRWPYHALVHQPLTAPRHMVVKRFKALHGQDVRLTHAKEAYFEQMEVQTVAAQMAEEFNKKLESHLIGHHKTVQFTLVSTLRVGSKFYNLEKFLEGTWIRYSNNLNYVNTKEYAATLHAFSHWTYHRSNGLLVVTDLQGIEMKGARGVKEFWLCDPAIHCKDALRYERTRTNWSEPGMKRFLEAHECNYICKKLRLAHTKGHV